VLRHISTLTAVWLSGAFANGYLRFRLLEKTEMTDRSQNTRHPFHKLKHHLFTNMLSGLLILAPFVVAFLIFRFVLRAVGSFVSPLAHFLPSLNVPAEIITILSVFILLIILYIIGAIGTYSLGKKMLSFSEAIFLKIPILKTVYSSTKTAASTFSMTQSDSFRAVVMIQFPREGFWSLGFMTGITRDEEGREYIKIFVPTAPNPTSGFFQIVSKNDVVLTDLSVEEGFQAILTGGILFPGKLPVANNGRANKL